MKNKPLGVYWVAVSRFDGAPIYIVCRSGKSNNVKTGDMRQVYYLPLGSPGAAVRHGADKAVCGVCPHRPVYGGRCYVAVDRGPRMVYRALMSGRYVPANSPEGRTILTAQRGRAVRYGAWGDPGSVDQATHNRIVEALAPAKWTAYTHAWRTAPWLKSVCMASVDSLAEQAEAAANGWRTFRVRGADEPLAPREFVCPAAEEAGKRLQCVDCYACNGNPHGRAGAGSPAIVAHGFRVGARRAAPLVQVENLSV